MVDRQKVGEYRKYLEAAVNEAAKKAGFASASIGTISFNDTEITCRVRTVVDPVKLAERKEVEQKNLSTVYGIKIGSTIQFGGKHYIFRGYTTRGHYLVSKPGNDKQYRISKKYASSVKVIG
jgi:hypothetical protein